MWNSKPNNRERERVRDSTIFMFSIIFHDVIKYKSMETNNQNPNIIEK
jgi:hypothetical protein